MRSDLGHRLTDKELEKLERKIAKVYSEASADLSDTIQDYFEKFKSRDEEMRKLVEDGSWSKQEYKKWRLAQIGRGERFEAMRDKLAEQVTEANERAIGYVNDAMPNVYALNRNYAAYTIEMASDAVDFTLYDEGTVLRLLAENPATMPYYPQKRAINRGIDLAYGQRQITASVTSGIIRGCSIKRIADELQTYITDMSRTSAIRAARTAMTSAQNGGRQASYDAAEKMGIIVQKEWMATKDERTRYEHGMADGQVVNKDDPFTVGGEKLMFPGDSSGSGWNIYNCRCTMRAVIPGSPYKKRETYKEWLEGKEKDLFHKQLSEESPFKPISDEVFNSLVAGAKAQGATIIKGGEWAESHLEGNKRASNIGDWLIFKDEVSKSDVHEELRHFWQRKNGFAEDVSDPDEHDMLCEIDAKKYLINNAKKLKIPRKETAETRRELEHYEELLAKYRGE